MKTKIKARTIKEEFLGCRLVQWAGSNYCEVYFNQSGGLWTPFGGIPKWIEQFLVPGCSSFTGYRFKSMEDARIAVTMGSWPDNGWETQ